MMKASADCTVNIEEWIIYAGSNRLIAFDHMVEVKSSG